MVQVEELIQPRRVIPDLATSLQCYVLYSVMVLQERPDRAAEMMAYQTAIAKASQRYKWPSWVICDVTFRQEMAGLSGASWARVDSSIYSLRFMGQA